MPNYASLSIDQGQSKSKSDDYNQFLFVEVNGRRGSLNINFIISAIIACVSGLVSTFFYIQIARHHLTIMRKNKRKAQGDEPDDVLKGMYNL